MVVGFDGNLRLYWIDDKQWDFVYDCGMELRVDIQRDDVNTDMVG